VRDGSGAGRKLSRIIFNGIKRNGFQSPFR
jgi:hypothetical protein